MSEYPVCYDSTAFHLPRKFLPIVHQTLRQFCLQYFFLSKVILFAGSQIPPDYVLSVHSSKALIVEHVKGPNYMLADAVIQLAVAKGDGHEVGINGLNLFT